MATPSVLAFDDEGRAIDFDVWVDDLQLFLQCDRAEGLSLFDLTSGASPAPAADADATVHSQWATRDAAARLAVRRHLPTSEHAHFSQYKSAQTLDDAVVARYSSPATAAVSRLMLPYLFPDLAAFPTVADLITHLRTSDTRYRAALPSEGVPPPPVCPLLLLLLRPASLGLSRSVRCLPLAGDAALARARGAGALEELAGAVEAVVEAAEGVGVAVAVVAGVEVSLAAVEAEEAAVVAVGAEVAEVAAVEEAVAEEVELVGVALRRGSASVVVSASSSSSALVTSPPLSSSVSGTLHASEVGVLVRVSQVDGVEPGEVTGDSGVAQGAEPGGAGSGGAERVSATPGGAETGGAEPGGAETGGTETGGAEPGGAEPWGAEPGGAAHGGAEPGGATSGGAEPGGAEPGSWACFRGAGAGGSSAAEGAGAAGPRGARSGGTGAAGPAGASGAGAAEGVGAEATAVGPGGGAAGGTGSGGAAGAGAAAGGAVGLSSCC
ncbi:unnamed protein product [Closterium sp. NIES-64]|nr:unnamed protein product [Closterium sp. NIES-64]